MDATAFTQLLAVAQGQLAAVEFGLSEVVKGLLEPVTDKVYLRTKESQLRAEKRQIMDLILALVGGISHLTVFRS